MCQNAGSSKRTQLGCSSKGSWYDDKVGLRERYLTKFPKLNSSVAVLRSVERLLLPARMSLCRIDGRRILWFVAPYHLAWYDVVNKVVQRYNLKKMI